MTLARVKVGQNFEMSWSKNIHIQVKKYIGWVKNYQVVVQSGQIAVGQNYQLFLVKLVNF